MKDAAYGIALATLSYWLAHATDPGQSPTIVPEQWREQMRRTAWQTTGMPEQAGWPQITDQLLQSIFNRVEPKSAQPPFTAWVAQNGLRLDRRVLFPCSAPAAQQRSTSMPAQELRQALRQVQSSLLPDHARLEHAFSALQEYAWCLPSPLEGVSLFDFARTHAAIAAVQVSEPGEVFLLGGDISGVQQFIYSLSSDGATKQLRGRSFYLQLLGEAIPQMIAQRAGLPPTNILYSGGGRFYLVVPPSFAHDLRALRQDVSSILLRRHAGELYVALGGAIYRGDQESWQQVNDAINLDKQRRFASLDADTLAASIFSPQAPIWSSDIEGTANDPLNLSLEKLGRDLHNKPYLSLRNARRNTDVPAAPGYEPTAWFNVLREFGSLIRPVEHRDLASSARYTRLLRMVDLKQSRAEIADALRPETALGTRYMVNVAPILEEDVTRAVDGEMETYPAGSVMPFNVIAERSQGIKRLGVLRMDVDDLGELFGRRLKRGGLASLAYTAALSAALSRFFEGWVGRLCRDVNGLSGEPGKVYAIYSGGDDLFIVGSWHLLPRLAAEIRADFVRYTTGLEDIPAEFVPPMTVSAGITLHAPKFPLYQAADIAAIALDAAKAHTRAGRAKDALTFLGQTIGWEDYPETVATFEELRGLIANDNLPRGVLITIQDMYSRYAEGRKRRRTRDGRPQFEFGPWVWQGKYRLIRLVGRSNDGVKGKVKALADKLTSDIQSRFIERAGLAARWAQLSLRERKDHL